MKNLMEPKKSEQNRTKEGKKMKIEKMMSISHSLTIENQMI